MPRKILLPTIEVEMSTTPSSIPAENSLQAHSEIEEDGLEVEQDDGEEEITHPFNPEKLKIRTVNLLVGNLISRIKYGEVDLAPDFQRMSGLWNLQRKSRLIESLLLRIPIPVFYVAADENEHWSVVDGIQRMTTINDYATGEYALDRLEYLNWLNGYKYENLPRPMQRRIDETHLIVNVIEPGTPPEVMFNIFLRINTGGLTLNGQEIRHALHPGPVRQYLKELAESKEFLLATDSSVNPKRMGDRECVLRFLAFYIEPWEGYTNNDLNGHLASVMDKLNVMSSKERETLSCDFKKAMRAAFETFGNDAFRKRTDSWSGRRPVSKALFETWSVQLARCSPAQIATLVDRREDVQSQFIELMRNDGEFDRAISYATGTPSRVQKRFEAIRTLVEEFA